MDSRRFDAIARSAAIPATRRSALGALVAGGILGAFGLDRAEPAPVAAQGQGGLCVLAFVATVRQGPSTSWPLVAGGAPGELRGYLRFSLARSGDLQNADLLLDNGSSLPVVGQATGHGFQARIDVGQGQALVAVGVGEQDVTRCLGRLDGPASGPEVGDLGEWHATAGVQNLPPGSGASGGAQAGEGGNRPAAGSTGKGSRSNDGGSSGGGNTGGGSTGGVSGRACPQGQTRCGDVCVDTQTDPANCGACGERCAVNNCTRGVCGETGAPLQNCAPPFGVCDGACVDLRSDARNCGRCGNTCPAGQVCAGGACAAAQGNCQQGFTDCGGSCADLTSESSNCGACGVECGVDEACVQSTCTLRCLFPRIPCAGVCVDSANDPLNCGGCGVVCAADEECRDGACRSAGVSSSGRSSTSAQTAQTCPSGQTLCGDACVDVQTDKAHCGQCGHLCASELGAGICIDGVCTCRPDTTRCDNVCVNTDRDPLNCGRCGTTCPGDGECLDGACAAAQTPCPDGQTRCGDACVAAQTDPANCGACGNTCATGETCTGGTCTPATTTGCPVGQVRCGGACVEALPNFGSDGISCPGGGAPPTECPAGRVLCNGACFPEGACQPAECAPGWGYCYGVCRDFQNDSGYCGGCGTACTGGTYCAAGTCVSCPEGQTLCGTGCVDTKADLNNCGFCGNLCGTQCIDGQCTGVGPAPTCAEGATRCGDACVDLARDVNNCGQCGNQCDSDHYCASPGVCFLTEEYCQQQYGHHSCGYYCTSFLSPLDCGGCGLICPGGYDCTDEGRCHISGSSHLDDVEPRQSLLPTGQQTLAPADVTTCAPGLVACGGVCVDVASDPLNCGGCGTACGEGSDCQGGLCTVPSAASGATLTGAEQAPISCPEGQVDCGGVCTDLSVNPLNCGACFTACAADDVCQDGLCTTPVTVDDTATSAGDESSALSCPAGQVDCGGICADVFADPLNCGSCGVVCESGSTCDFGVCTAAAGAAAPVDADTTQQSAPAESDTTCAAAGDACDPASPGACCSGVCNGDATCA